MSTQSIARRTVRRVVGTLDAVAAPHGVDRYVEQFVPTWSSTEVRGRIVAADRTAPDSVVLTIRPNGNWNGFSAGQYTQLSVDIDGVRHTRCYSMANGAASGAGALRSGTIQLGVKAHPHGLVSRHLVANARVGDVVGLTPAAGEFTLAGSPGRRADRILLISGGSGITPVLAMLRTLVDEGHAGSVTFLHYARDPRAMLFRHEVEAIAASGVDVTLVRVYDDATSREPGQLTGFLTPAHLDAADADWRDAETYVCGPAPMMDAARDAFAAVDALDHFHTEAFTLTTLVGEAGDVGGALHFTDAQVRVDSDGATILDQAEANGLTPLSGCRMGICHTCTRSLTCGTVRNVATGELTSTDPAAGAVEIRICVNAPVGDVDISL